MSRFLILPLVVGPVPLIINAKTATAVLLEEAERAEVEAGNSTWADRLEHLDSLCKGIAQTHIAAIGTAILAKAVDVNVDVYSLKRTKNGPRAYVARALAKDVLAARAPQLEMDIGVYGREPLNNQPYFRESRISREMPVKGNARPALFYVVDLLDLLDRIETEDKAREVLRTYIKVRRGHFRRPGVGAPSGAIAIDLLITRIETFVASGSEGGKRAQAVAAGLLGAAFGEEYVKVTRVNDPDRTLPADVGVLRESGEIGWERVLEVRDKSVTEPDLHHLIHKAAAAGVDRVALLSVASKGANLEIEPALKRAAADGIQLAVYESWGALIREAVFWTRGSVAGFGEAAIAAIDRRLINMDVRSETLAQWRAVNVVSDVAS